MLTRRVGLAAALAVVFAAGAAHAEGGMPQLDFGNPLLLAQVVWEAVIFLALYLLLSQWALPKVAGVLDLRAARIAEDLARARVAKDEADAAVAELERATREAHGQAQAAIAQAIAEAKAQAAARAAEDDRRLDAQIAAAEQRIAAARQSALGALEQVAADTTTAMVTRLTGAPAEPQAVQRAVAQALAAWRGNAAAAA